MCVCCCCCCFIAKSCPTLWDAMACSSPGSTVHVISQARILEWVAISFSRGSSQPRDGTSIYGISCLAVGLFTTEPSGKLMYLCIFCNWEKQKTKNKKQTFKSCTCWFLYLSFIPGDAHAEVRTANIWPTPPSSLITCILFQVPCILPSLLIFFSFFLILFYF